MTKMPILWYLFEVECKSSDFLAKQTAVECLPCAVRGYDESHGQKVMQNHDKKVLAPSIHEDGGVQWVQVEAALDEVEQLYLFRDDTA